MNTIGDNQVRVQTRTLTPDEVTDGEVGDRPGGGRAAEDVAYSAIGASWGRQITTQALIALVVFLALVMLVIWAYFRNGR